MSERETQSYKEFQQILQMHGIATICFRGQNNYKISLFSYKLFELMEAGFGNLVLTPGHLH